MLAEASDVRVDRAAAERAARNLLAAGSARPAWRVPPHWWDDLDPEHTARYVLLLDALNFSFWGEPKWSREWGGTVVDGYWALAAALREALESGARLWEPSALRNIDARQLLAGRGGTEIPLLDARQATLREVADGLDALGEPFLPWLARHGADVGALVDAVAARFPSFTDLALYRGQAVPFFKRAQILVADLWGAWGEHPPIPFPDLGELTMFADYKVPQVLHGLGVLVYSDGLARLLHDRAPLASGDPREVEIRAGAIQGVEALLDAAEEGGVRLAAFDVDWRLWALGQGRSWPLPYHRTRSLAY